MTEPLTWKNYYRPIADGTQVRASVTNSPLSDLFQNQVYLKNVLDTTAAGKALVIPDQVVDSLAAVGTPVYLTTTGVWRPALAELDSSPTSSLFTLTSKAFVAGIVTARNTSGRGDVAIQGQVTIGAAFASVIEGTFVEGLQYLSPYTAGKLSSSRGVAPVRVCLAYGPDTSGNYRVIINPDQRLQLESHGHYHFELEDAPAGEANCVPGKEGFMWGDLEPDGPYPGIIHVVVNSDSTQRGWLPITDPIFADMDIPVGAKFGYNIAMDPELAAIWPPLPVESVAVEVDGNGETGDLVEVNADGIWWMDDHYGKAPWPVNLPCTPGTSSSDAGGPYPIWPVRIELWFTKTLHGTTVEALNNQIDVMNGVNPGIAPVAVGSEITEVLMTSGVPAYQLVYPVESGSSSGGLVDNNSIIYRLDGRAFTVIGTRIPKVAIEVVLGGVAGLVSTANHIRSGLSLYLTTAPAGALTGYKAFSDIVPQTLQPWASYPADLSVVPAEKYFTMRSPEISLGARDIYYIELAWDGTFLLDAADIVYLMAVRPVVTL